MNEIASALMLARVRTQRRAGRLRNMETAERLRRLAELRAVMFARREKGESFHELDEIELAILEETLREHEKDGRLFIVDRKQQQLRAWYEIIRHNHICGREEVGSGEFRSASEHIAGAILDYLMAQEAIDLRRTVFLMPWRAGLAFGEAACHRGFEHFYHLGARRDEDTLETQIYFEEIPPVVDPGNPLANRKLSAVVADPMLATGNTAAAAIKRLKSLGIPEERILSVAVISAPEGVDQVLHLFPKVKVVVGSHDERLNSKGYIESGCGDYGDRLFAGIQIGTIFWWKTLGILSESSRDRLYQRMEGK